MDTKQLNIAVCGGWAAHAADFARRALTDPGVRIAAVWDESEAFANEFAAQFGCRVAPDYEALLADPDLDGVIITARTSLHAAMTVQAAQAGKHVYLEKAPALTNEEAYAMRDAVRRSGIHFTVSDPMEKPHFLYVKKLLDDGVLGEPTLLRYRTAHDGALQGENWYLWPRFYDAGEGGAMMDIGCHAVHLLTMFLGKPLRCSASINFHTETGRNNRVDENSVAVYEFENGAVGVAEVGWVTPHMRPNFELSLYGTRGVARMLDGALRYMVDDGGAGPHGREPAWIDVSPEDYPAEQQHPMYYWLDSVRNDTPNTLHGIDEAVRFTEMLSAAYRAAQRGEVV